MPYPANADLPPPVRNHLPRDAQTAYRQAFNRAWFTYAHDSTHRVAWTAVKRGYRKGAGDMWVPLRPQRAAG